MDVYMSFMPQRISSIVGELTRRIMNPPGTFAQEGDIISPGDEIISAEFGKHRQTMDAMVFSESPVEA